MVPTQRLHTLYLIRRGLVVTMLSSQDQHLADGAYSKATRSAVAWASEKVASDLGLGSGFLQCLQLASHELATIGINVTKKKKFQT